MNRLDQTIRLRGEERRRGSERRAGAQTQHLERRSVLMRQQEYFVAPQFDRRNAGVAIEERLPDDRGVFDPSRRRNPRGELVLHPVDGQQERLWRVRDDDQCRIFHRVERRPASDRATQNRHRVRLQIPRFDRGVEVLFRLRRAAFEFLEPDEVQRLRVGAPRRGAELRAIDRPRDLRAARRVVNEQRCRFRSAGRDPHRHLRSVGRGKKVVDRVGHAAVACAQRRNVDQRARAAFRIAHHQVEFVRSRCTLFVERAAAVHAVALYEAETTGEIGDALQQRRPRRDRIENAAGVVALRLHPRHGVGSHLFEVTIAIGERGAVEGFGYRRGRRERRFCKPDRRASGSVSNAAGCATLASSAMTNASVRRIGATCSSRRRRRESRRSCTTIRRTRETRQRGDLLRACRGAPSAGGG